MQKKFICIIDEYRSILIQCTVGFLLTLFLYLLVACSSQPLPQFYGVYAISQKQLYLLEEYQKPWQGDNQMSSITVLPTLDNLGPETYFILYGEDKPENITLTYLQPIRTQKKISYKISFVTNGWVSKGNINIKTAPIEKKQSMYKCIPSSILNDGLYSIKIKGQNEKSYLFFCGSLNKYFSDNKIDKNYYFRYSQLDEKTYNALGEDVSKLFNIEHINISKGTPSAISGSSLKLIVDKFEPDYDKKTPAFLTTIGFLQGEEITKKDTISYNSISIPAKYGEYLVTLSSYVKDGYFVTLYKPL